MSAKSRIVPIEVMTGPNTHVCADGTKRVHGSIWENRWRVEVDVEFEGDAKWLQGLIDEVCRANDV